MNAQDLKQFRLRKGWSQNDLAMLINRALGRKMTRSEIGKYENGKKTISAPISEFLDHLALDDGPPDFQVLDGDREVPFEVGDTPPPPPPASGEQVAGQVAALVGGGTYSRVCEELWELIATGVGMVGAVTGSDSLRRDGEIIANDKAALGKAYGKLAEQNATFRAMLAGMTGGGAWLEVALVSGITAGKIMRNHQQQSPPAPAEVPQPEREPEGRMYGDGAVIDLPV